MKLSRHIKLFVAALLLQLLVSPLFGQKEIKQVRQGNRNYKDNNFTEAEMSYRRSIDENPEYSNAVFNLGDALYKQDKYEDAFKSFASIAESELEAESKSGALYNIGNTLLKSNKLEESIEAYKSALRNNPEMMQAKYNLAYAQDLLKKQEEEEKEQEKNKDENKDQQDKNDKDQNQDESDDNKDEQKDDQQDQAEEDKKDNEDQQKQEKPQEQQMSKEDAERLLQALAADEQNVQEKVKKAKAAKSRIRTLKNW